MLDLMPDTATSVTLDPRWDTLTHRVAGDFFYSVRTTGVYCRPTCASRLPKPENVDFYATCAEAEAAGFRPCKRCRPRGDSQQAQQAALIADVCRFIEDADEALGLDEMAARAGLSPHHFHRLFKSVTGLTPKAYAEAHRTKRVREGLATGEAVTAALYDAGYGSSSRFYERSDAILGMTPKAFQTGGAGDIRFAIGQCSLGAVLVAQSDRGLCAITLGDDAEALAHDLQDRFPKANLIGADEAFEQTVARVIGLIDRGQALDLPLDIRGTVFQQRVWQALRAIPTGETRSYAEVAEAIGSPAAVRAVAGACAANALAVAIPCHRVVRTDGALSGYRWGVERKRALLLQEGGHV
ncbi:MAG: bifunctional DNA-binding transcriptional regulator/O6-methylguanine-DNA methyltransferase Ada [Asticcacaulis sp.]|uniref:bifunctional DNA-binding transcriptional regulator/O6-methylguanine-DNA methyltransferase Ada n=1 Tax=Asticcacaulis sp. TaxID=1872648 RepID=UPI0039E69546